MGQPLGMFVFPWVCLASAHLSETFNDALMQATPFGPSKTLRCGTWGSRDVAEETGAWQGGRQASPAARGRFTHWPLQQKA